LALITLQQCTGIIFSTIWNWRVNGGRVNKGQVALFYQLRGEAAKKKKKKRKCNEHLKVKNSKYDPES
jgi:hypothetical protein